MCDIDKPPTRTGVPPWHDVSRGTPAECVAIWRRQRESALYMLSEAADGRTRDLPQPHLRELGEFVDWLFSVSARLRTDRAPDGPVAATWSEIESQIRNHLSFIDETLTAYGAGVAGAD